MRGINHAVEIGATNQRASGATARGNATVRGNRARAGERGGPRGGFPSWRARLVLIAFLLGFGTLVGRAAYLQSVNEAWLQARGDKRYVHNQALQAVRGRVFDRNGELLASSVPTRSIWLLPAAALERDDAANRADTAATDPQGAKGKKGAGQLQRHNERVERVAAVLGIAPTELNRRIDVANGRRVLLERHAPLDRAEALKRLRVGWIEEEFSYLRNYAAGESTAHVVGFINAEEHGQDGVERAFQSALAGKGGVRRVVHDRIGRVIDEPHAVRPVRDGADVTLAIDSRVQAIAHRALKQAMIDHRAAAGGVMVVDVQTGEILALANAPTFDPNDRSGLKEKDERLRNRAVTDLFEPGSTLKPLVVAAALERGRLKPNMVLDTYDGKFTVGAKVFTDSVRARSMSVTEIVQKSSNIGAIRIAMEFMERDVLANFLQDVGFGTLPHTGMPNEVVGGRLRPAKTWKPIEHATIAFGHGVSISLAQLARAYTLLARDGEIIPLSILKVDQPPVGRRLLSPETVGELRGMLEAVVSPKGTAPRAQIRGYRVAGKTGTARKLENGRYNQQKHVASFVGFAPVSAPRLVVVVVIDEPRGGQHYGGAVAAPVFATIMSGALHVLGVRHDAPLAPIALPAAADELPEGTG